MELAKIEKLIEMFEHSSLLELELRDGGDTIRLCRAGQQSLVAVSPVPPVGAMGASELPPDAVGVAVGAADPSIDSPMVGTYFAAAAEGTAPYVAVGSKVDVGDVLCLIEAMKTFNQVEADKAGTITAVHKNNGDPVEFGEPLFSIA